jgi:hypothetical protein
VREGSRLDQEAFHRGTSVYFPERAIPMLPERLSNGICSLNPGVDRLVQSVFVEVSPAGKLVSSRFAEGVIRSRARMTYTKVKQILVDRDPAVTREHKDLVPAFERMQSLYKILRARRETRGSIDFTGPRRSGPDDKGRVIDVRASRATSPIASSKSSCSRERDRRPTSPRATLPDSGSTSPDDSRVEAFEEFLLGWADSALRAPQPAGLQRLRARRRKAEERPSPCDAPHDEEGRLFRGERRTLRARGAVLHPLPSPYGAIPIHRARLLRSSGERRRDRSRRDASGGSRKSPEPHTERRGRGGARAVDWKKVRRV